MGQLTFKFPFKTNYFKKDFYVSSNNFAAYELIESRSSYQRTNRKNWKTSMYYN